jgi:hypothetical protein
MAAAETPSFSGRLLGSGSPVFWAAAEYPARSKTREIQNVDGFIMVG